MHAKRGTNMKVIRLLSILVCIGAPLPVAQAAMTYYAYCNHEAHDANGGWKGPTYSDAQKARDDCASHLRSFPGHRCNIQDERM
jgi:hypothetical protein